MTDPLWRRTTQGLLALLWMLCCFSWVAVLTGGHATGGLVGALVGSTSGRWYQRKRARRADHAYEALPADGRAVVDEALAAGELHGPIALRQVERDLARARLLRGETTPAWSAAWLALALALLVVVLMKAPTHPPWLVVASVIDLTGAAVLALVVPGADALDRDERRRLKAVSKAPLGY